MSITDNSVIAKYIGNWLYPTSLKHWKLVLRGRVRVPCSCRVHELVLSVLTSSASDLVGIINFWILYIYRVTYNRHSWKSPNFCPKFPETRKSQLSPMSMHQFKLYPYIYMILGNILWPPRSEITKTSSTLYSESSIDWCEKWWKSWLFRSKWWN